MEVPTPERGETQQRLEREDAECGGPIGRDLPRGRGDDAGAGRAEMTGPAAARPQAEPPCGKGGCAAWTASHSLHALPGPQLGHESGLLAHKYLPASAFFFFSPNVPIL